MAIQLVDRQREIQRLQTHAGNAPAIIVMRGRRRVGKSFLLRAAFPDERVISFQADEQPEQAQLDLLAQEASRIVPGAPPLVFGDWYAALDFFEGQAKAGGPLTVILDEFQWLAGSQSNLDSMIMQRWDRWDREQTPLTLILSGSALSFMAGLFQNSSNPTFGRSVYRPLILPLSYKDTPAFARKGASTTDLIERYAVIGGTPQYQRWAGTQSLDQVIKTTILETDASLYEEPLHLLRGEETIRTPGPYFATLAAIAAGRTRPVDIAGRLQVSQPGALKFLERLAELGYIEEFNPVEPRHTGDSRGVWRIKDPYFRFWFRFVFSNRSRLERGRVDEVAVEIKRDLDTFIGTVFEDCCREWVGSHSPLGASADEVGSWWSRKGDTEIDVAAVAKNGYTVLGSCKWSRRQVGENILDDLYDQRALLGRQAAQAELALFSKSGFTPALEKRAKAEGVHLITADDLFA
jgi:AAA+ ATPase superfamily predicted ATPase